MNLTRYSEMKAKGKVILSKQVDPETQDVKYTLTSAHYDQETGELAHPVIQEVTAADVQAARQELSDERDDLLAKRDSLDELISDAQAL